MSDINATPELDPLSSLMPSDLTLAGMTIIIAFFCCRQLLRLNRLVREFKTYTSKKDVPAVDFMQAILDKGRLDKHQKILRIETLFAGGQMAMTLSLLLALVFITW